jgi:hypothetical protein
MDYSLKFVIDDYDSWYGHVKKRVNINRRNREEVMNGYTDTVYSWRISRFVSNYTGEEFGYGQGPDQKAEELNAEGVLDSINTDYCFDFDYEPVENDILSIQFNYRNPEITRRARPHLYPGYILLRYNGTEWEGGWRFREVYEEIYRGILHITPK